jgi:hypothetical protein
MLDEKKDEKKSSKKDLKLKDTSKYIEMDPVLENEQEMDEALTLAQRKKRGRTMKRLAGRIARKKKISMRKKASNEKLISRAEKKARGAVKAKLAGGKKYNDLSISQKIQVDKKVDSKVALIKRLAKRMMPDVRKKEVERMARLRTKKEEFDINEAFEMFLLGEVSESDPCWDDYEMVGMKKKNGKEVPNCVPKEEVEEKPHKKRFHRLLDDNNKPLIDRRFKIYRKSENARIESFGEEALELMNMVEEYGAGFEGTDELAKKYRSDTPGQKENYYDGDIPSDYGTIEKGDRVSFRKHSMDMMDEYNDEKEGEVVGSTTSYLRIRDDEGKLFRVRHDDATLIEGASIFTLDEAFEFRFLNEAEIIDKAVAAARKHVLKGLDLMDIADEIVKLTGLNVSARDIIKAYVKEYGNPKEKKVSPQRTSELRRKYL